ncbi:MAG: heme-binding protein [Sphingomonadales bacterium]|nr:heme-binding protein [Sphingomonadales bacterium]
MKRALLAAAALAGGGAAWAQPLFHDTPAGPRALPGDRLPPFAMLTDSGELPLAPPPLAAGVSMPPPGGPPESTAPGPDLAAAMRMAQAAVAACAGTGHRVGAAVIDSAGEARAMLTADGSDGSHVFIAMRKAEVALTFGIPSSAAGALVTRDARARARVTAAMFVEGGAVPIVRGGALIGAIGVSGAMGMPIGHADEQCARAGLAAW